MIRGLLFDKDDTLIDLAPFWKAPVEHIAAIAARERGIACSSVYMAAVLKACGFEGETLRDGSPLVSGTNRDVSNAVNSVLIRLGCSPVNADALALELERACFELGEIRPKEDAGLVASCLRSWKADGIFLAIASSDSGRTCGYCLEKLGILDLFDEIYAGGCGFPPKPDPSAARDFLRRHGLQPYEAAMVGDSAGDMRFAKNAGIHGILYRNPLPASLPEGADAGAVSFWEINALLGRVSKA